MYCILFKETTKRIIENLLGGKKSLTELADIMDISKPALQQKYLGTLEELGIVSKRLEKNRKGREAYYYVERFSLFLSIDPENKRGISFTTSSRFQLPTLLLEQIPNREFREDLHLLMERMCDVACPNGSSYIIVFGSVARGEGTWKSDIDIAILQPQWDDETRKVYLDLLSELTMRTKHQIKPLFFSFEEFEYDDSALIREIKDFGIVIFGDIFGGENIWSKMKQHRNITILAESS